MHFCHFKHVDHTHPDAIISLCCADNGREIAEAIYGDRFVWVPYVRPGFTLSKMIAEGVRDNPKAELVLMEKHGLVTWGETSRRMLSRRLRSFNEAEAYIEARVIEVDKRFRWQHSMSRWQKNATKFLHKCCRSFAVQ